MRRIIANKGGIKTRTEYIKSLGLHDLFEKTYGREGNAIFMCKKVIEFTKEHGRYPNKECKNQHEKRLGIWIQLMRKAKKMHEATERNGACIFYPILEQMAVEAGFPEMFNIRDLESISIKKCAQVIEFYQTYNHYPVKESNDPYEKNLGHWLSNMKQAKKGKSKTKLYNSCKQMAEKANLYNMFNTTNKEQTAINKCKEVILFYKTYGRYPIKESNDSHEKKLGSWIKNMKQAKKGNANDIVFYPILEEMTNEANLLDIFNIINNEHIAINNCNNVISFFKINQRYPSSHSTDSYERKIGTFLNNMRSAKKSKNNKIFYDKCELIAINNKLPNMFNANWKNDLIEKSN